jgi:hypothetical protein
MQACEAVVAWSDSPISLISFATLLCQDDEKKNKTLLFSDHGPSTNNKFATEFITPELYCKGERKFHAQAQALDPFVLAFWKEKTEPSNGKTCLGFFC